MNMILGVVHIPAVSWLFKHPMMTVVIANVWHGTAFSMLNFQSALDNVSGDIEEAARVDGAGRWKQMLHVTIPCIRSTIVILLIMNLGKIMGGSFERVNSLMNVATTEYTTTIPILVYNWGIKDMKFSQSTALGLFQSLIGLMLVLFSDFIAKRLGEDGLI